MSKFALPRAATRVSGFAVIAAISAMAALVLFTFHGPAFAALSAPKSPFGPVQSAQVWSPPQFSWGAVTGAAKYRLEIATDPALSSSVASYQDIGNNSIMPPDSVFVDGTTYYWAVWAANASGVEGSRSQVMSFTRKFVRPTGATPDELATVRELPTFSWNEVVNAYQYEFELCGVPDCSEVMYTATVAGNRLTPPISDLSGLPEQLLYWRVRWVEANFIGETGEAGPWSAINPFTNNFGYGLSTALSSPAGAVTADVIPAFSWSHFPGAFSYELVIADDSLLNNSLIAQDSIPNNSMSPVDDFGLLAGTYYWAVTPYDSDGNPGPRSTIRSFNYTGAPAPAGTLPQAPQVLAPAAAASSSDAPSLAWSPLGGAVKYDVELASDAGFGAVLASKTTYTTSITATNTLLPSEVLSSGTYYWRVRGVDELGAAGEWSAARAFSKTLTPAPVLRTPSNGASITSGSGLLDWDPIPGIGQYEVYLSNSPLFSSESVLSVVLSGNYYTTVKTTAVHATDEFDPNNLLSPGTWYWKVVGLDAQGIPQTESAVRSFVKAKYAAPGVTSPASGSLSTEAPILRWKGVTGIGQYDVQISKSSGFTSGSPKRVPSNSITAAPELDFEQRLGNGTWYWRVRAVDNDLTPGFWSTTRSLIRYRALYQDNSSSIAYAARKEESSASYAGTWSSSLSTSYSRGKAKVSTAKYAYATLSFAGSKVTLLGMKGPARGKAKIYIDGAYKTTIDTYSSTTKYQQALYSKTGLSSGPHKIKIVVTRTKNTKATGYQIGIDAVEYPSSWTASSKSSYWGGTSRIGSGAGKRATLSFSGTGVAVYATKGPAYGKAEVIIDGKSKGTVDLYSASTAYKKAVYQIEGLAYGTHKIAVSALGVRNSSSKGTVVPLDAVITY